MKLLKLLVPKQWRGFSFSTFRKGIRTFRPALKGERAGIVSALALTVCASLLELLQPWPLKFILDRIVGGPGVTAVGGLTKTAQVGLAAGAFLVIVGLGGLISLKAAMASAQVSKNVTIRIRRQVFGHLHRLAFPFHQSNRTGDLLQRLMGDVDGVRNLIFSAWIPLIERTLFFVGIAVVIAVAIDPQYMILALAPLPVYALLVGRGNRRLKRLVRKQRRRQSESTSLAAESLQQIKVVKAFAGEDAAAETFSRQAASGEDAEAESAKLNAKIAMTSDLCRASGVALVLLVGALDVMGGRLSAGSLVLMATYARSMYRPLAKLSQQGTRLTVSSVSAERLMEVLAIPAEDPDAGIPAPHFAGDVQFESVRYEHRGGVEALTGLSFHLQNGQLAVISGPNGSGKSTTIAVLLRLITPQSGRVLIDGKDIEQFQIDSYRRSFAYVPQDVQLFGASIRENILYGRPEASDEEVTQAARVALFDEVVARKPQGYDTKLGEGGDTLSGGEARRLMLARAAIRDASILLLDEPLTGLDPEAREIIARAIKSISRGRTTLVVSHGPADELSPDVNIRLEAGKRTGLYASRPDEQSGRPSVADGRPSGRLDSPPDPWWRIGDLSRISSPDSACQLLAEAGLDVEAVSIDSLRLWPRRALASMTIQGRTPDSNLADVMGYVKTWKDKESAIRAVKRGAMQPLVTPFGPGVRLLPGSHSALYLFPYDAQLPGLATWTGKQQVLGALAAIRPIEKDGWKIDLEASTYEPVKYRPERRFLARADLVLKRGEAEQKTLPLFLRYFPDDRGTEIARICGLLAESGIECIPRPFGVAAGGRLYVEDRIDGIELFEQVHSGDACPQALAERLLALQQAGIDAGSPIPPGRLVKSVEVALAMLSEVDPQLMPAALNLAVLVNLTAPRVAYRSAIQGDLHLHQVLAKGGELYFVDFERAGCGDPLQDVGSLVAHLLGQSATEGGNPALEEFAASFVEQYWKKSGMNPRPADLAFFTACALILRAESAVRSLEPGWHSDVVSNLQLAEDVAAPPAKAEHAPTRSNPQQAPSNPGPRYGKRSGRLAETLFERAERVAGQDCRWEIFYPHVNGPWAGLLRTPHGRPLYVSFDPESGALERALPGADPELAPLGEWLHKGELLGYRAGRKATLRVEAGPEPHYARVMTVKKYLALRSRLRIIERIQGPGEGGFPHFAPVLYCEPQVILSGSVSGRALRRILQEDEALSTAALRSVGDALARFHQVGDAADLPQGAPFSFRMDRIAARAAAFFPDQALLFERTLPKLAEPSANGSVTDRLVHGDLHDGNIFVGAEGVALIDLEALTKGDPVKDVGNLCAELVVDAFKRGREAAGAWRLAGEFLDGYRSAGGKAASREVAIAASHCLYRLACLYLFRRQWQHLAPYLLEQAEIWSRQAKRAASPL